VSAFLVVDSKIENPEGYELYKAQAKPIAESYGGVYRARGGELETVEADLWQPTRMVIIEFPDMEKARAFDNSEEYQPVKALRHASATCTIAIIDGF